MVEYQSIEVNIGEAIKQGLKKKDLTRKDFAKVVNKSISLVSEWTRNVKTPSGKDLVKIALYLDIVENLFPGYTKESNQVAESVAVYNKNYHLEQRVSKLEKSFVDLEKSIKNK